jgi:phytoene dehydrogenase-like protein
MQMSTLDILDDWFEDHRVKATLARFVSEIIVSPDDIGTGVFFFIMVPLLHTFGMAIPEGGSGALSNSLKRCIEANGGTVYTDSQVVNFRQSGGRINAVVLDSGEVIEGKKAVLANLNIKQIPMMLEAGALDDEFLRKVKGVKNSVFSGLNINLSLNNAPMYKAGNEVNKTCIVELCDFLPEMRQEFDGLKYGKLSTNMPGVITPTIFDKTRAPEGKHTLYMFQYNSFNVEGQSDRWKDLKDEATQRVIENFRKHTTNMGDDNIVGKTSWTPLDLRNFNDSWIAGDPLHMRNMIAQFFSHRPFAEAGYYKLPIEGLYLCGPSSHPGGGVTGGARAAAMYLMDELGIDFDSVIEK